LYFFWIGIQKPRNRGYDLLIGVMTVFSFLFRANNIGMGVAIALTWVIIGIAQRQFSLMIKRLVAMLVGGGLASLCAGLFLWSRGILGAAWNAAILYNFSYVGNHTSILSSIIPGFGYLGLVAWISLLGYGAVLFSVVRMLKIKAFDAFMLLMLVLWPVEILLSSLSGRSYMHYFVNWLPAAAILCAYFYHFSAPTLLSGKSISFLNTEKIPVTAAALLAVFICFNRVMDYSLAFRTLAFDRSHGVEAINKVSLYIRRNTGPQDRVLDWVQSGVNYMSQRDAPTAYLWYPEYLPSRITSTLVDGFYQDITSNPPEIIVDSYLVAPDDILSLNPDIRWQQMEVQKGLSVGRAGNLEQTLNFIQAHYKVETQMEGQTVYRLIKP
jgi:hypothetical protein